MSVMISVSSNFNLGVEKQNRFVQQHRAFNVHHFLGRHVDRQPDSPAIIGEDRQITYADLDKRSTGLANALLDRFPDPSEASVAVLSENRPELAELFYACSKAGVLFAPQNWRLQEEELVHCVDLVNPDLIVYSDRFEDKIEWVRESETVDPLTVGLDDNSGHDMAYEALVNRGDQQTLVRDNSINPQTGVAVLYTSGTTGLPKGAVVSHNTFLARVAQWVTDLKFDRGDSFPGWGPMFHQGGIDPLVFTAHLGGAYYTIDGFDREQIIRAFQERPISWIMLVPGVIQPLIDYIEENEISPESFEDIGCVGALIDLVSSQKVKRITELLDAPYQCTYGATENGQIASTNRVPVGVEPDDSDIVKEHGSFLRMKLVDQNGDEVEQGEPGEMIVRGPTLCSGYLQNQRKNREEFRDGWFRTGDIFVEIEDGKYDFVNRRKYMLKPGGENVFPGEIERPLLEHEAVDDAVVVRVPDERWGEVPRAVISTETPDEVSPDEVLEYLRNRIAAYKLPHYVEFVDPGAFPRSSTGKIVREEVEEWSVSDSIRARNP